MTSQKVGAREPHVSPVITRRRFAQQMLRRAQQQGGMTLLVDGPAGMGKTYLLRELIDATEDEGRWKVTFVRADEIERGEPFSFIERLVASSLIPDWHFVSDAQLSPVVVARECIRRLVTETESPDRVMVIDDAQWIDAESQRVLRYMIPRITRRNVLLAFGTRSPHTPESFGEVLTQIVGDSPLDTVYHVEPLSAQDVYSLTLDRLGVGVSSVTAQRIAALTGGSFLEVDSMLSALTSDEIAELQFAWDVPITSLARDDGMLLYPFHQMSREAQATCEIVCLAGHELSRDEIAAASRLLGETPRLPEAIKAEVLSESGFGSRIMPRHDLLSRAVSNTVSRERSRNVYRALADVTTGYRSLRHTLLGADQWDESLRIRVNDFALENLRKGNVSSASEMLRAALGVAKTPDERMDLVESLALLHIQGKTGYLVLDLLEEIHRFPPSILHEFIDIVISAHNVSHSIPMDRVQRLLAAPAKTPDERAILAFFAFMIVILSMRSENIEMVPALIQHAKGLIAQAPSDAGELEDPRLEWMVEKQAHLLVLDCYLMVQDQFRNQTAEVAAAVPELTRRAGELHDTPLKVDALVAIAGGQLSVGNAREGRALAQHGVELLDRVGEPWAASTARLILTDCFVLFGELDEAMALIELTNDVAYSALDVETRATWAALEVIIAAITGQDDAASHMQQARNQMEIGWEGYGPDLALIAECELARAQGDIDAVLRASSSPWARQIKNTRHGFLTYRAHALIEAGHLDEAAELIAQLSEWRGTRWLEYWGALDWLEAKHAWASGDAPTAKWRFEAAIQNREFPLPLGLTLSDFGTFLMEQGEHAAGTEMLRAAIETLESIGAEGYLPRIREAAGGAPAAPLQEGARDRLLGTLTTRERQIVDQLIKGRSNSQIAESLVVSVTTVRSHVSNVLRKLRISSRGEVVRLFRQAMDSRETASPR